MTYGLVECLFSQLLPWILERNLNLPTLQWKTSALLLGSYAAVGLAFGGLCGLVFRATPARRTDRAERALAAAAVTTVVVAFIANLATVRPLLEGALPLAIALTVLLGISSSVGPGEWRSRLRRLMNPWAVSFLLIGTPWTTKELLWDRPVTVKLGAVAVTVAAILAASLALRAVFHAHAEAAYRPALRAIAVFAAAAVALGWIFDGRPELPDPDSLPPRPARPTPHVVLISLDTVRADHLSVYGYERDTSPRLRELAAEATLYTRAIAASDMTLSTHASIFTGLYPGAHGAHHAPDHPLGRPLPPEIPTLPEILAGMGYLTLGVVANRAYLQSAYGFDRGFHYYDQRAPFFPESLDVYLRQAIRDMAAPLLSRRFGLVYRRAEEINDEVFALLDVMERAGRPAFLFVNYMDAHPPVAPPPPFDDLFPGRDPSFSDADFEQLTAEVMTLERDITDRERRHLISQYDGGIANLDFHVGRLIDRLKEMGLYDDCLLIVTSDHGEVFGERSLVGHGVSVYQDQVHVPLIIKYPNSRRPAVRSDVASSIDLLPTILATLGHPVPEDLRGQSLREKTTADRAVISENFPSQYFIDWHERFRREQRAIVSGALKLIVSTDGRRELYALPVDPAEAHDLYDSNVPQAEKLAEALERLADPGGRELPGAARLDKSALDRLRALGYVH